MSVAGAPRMAVLDVQTSQIAQFQYAAASQVDHPLAAPFFTGIPTPGAVWLSHIAAMVTDNQGHLWYIRAGWSQIEEVAA